MKDELQPQPLRLIKRASFLAVLTGVLSACDQGQLLPISPFEFINARLPDAVEQVEKVSYFF